MPSDSSAYGPCGLALGHEQPVVAVAAMLAGGVQTLLDLVHVTDGHPVPASTQASSRPRIQPAAALGGAVGALERGDGVLNLARLGVQDRPAAMNSCILAWVSATPSWGLVRSSRRSRKAVSPSTQASSAAVAGGLVVVVAATVVLVAAAVGRSSCSTAGGGQHQQNTGDQTAGRRSRITGSPSQSRRHIIPDIQGAWKG